MAWPQLLIDDGGSVGTALTGSTTPTSILHAGSKYQFLPNAFRVGSKLYVETEGRVTNIGAAPGTLTLDIRGQSIVVANGGAMALNTVAKTDVPWILKMILTCRSIGSGTAATFMPQGTWTSESVVGSPLPSAGGAGTLPIPAGAPVVGTGFDSSAAFTLDLFATWSLNNANSIRVEQFRLWALNFTV